MPITPNEVKWGSYSSFEGPVFWGNKPYVMPKDPTFLQKALAVISSTEGHLNSVNMYDVCIMTVGVIQWCDRGQFSVTNMLGKVADDLGLDYVTTVLKPALDLSKATFHKNSSGIYRFFLVKDDETETEVNSDALQKQLYLSCSGQKGSFTAEAMLHAKTWCACMVNVWDDDRACVAQIDFTGPKLMGFVGWNAKKILFGDPAVGVSGWVGAVKAAYLSYAINMPAIADRQLVIGSNSTFPKWSPGWCLDVIKQLTFGPQIAIYPARYNAIRSVIETQFGVTMPKTATQLLARPWATDPNAGIVPSTAPDAPLPPPVAVEPVEPEPTPAPEPMPEPVPVPEPAPIVPVDPTPARITIFGWTVPVWVGTLITIVKDLWPTLVSTWPVIVTFFKQITGKNK